jgi:hypothetical protein
MMGNVISSLLIVILNGFEELLKIRTTGIYTESAMLGHSGLVKKDTHLGSHLNRQWRGVLNIVQIAE